MLWRMTDRVTDGGPSHCAPISQKQELALPTCEVVIGSYKTFTTPLLYSEFDPTISLLISVNGSSHVTLRK